jgi:hypothetical protein
MASVEDQDEPERGSSTAAVGLFARFSGYLAKGLRYWEPRRVIYNGVLILVVLAHLFLAWPGSREKLSVDLVLGLFFLAVLANVAYCAAYVPDLFVQFSGLDAAWRRGRVGLLIVGTAFAATITHFFAKGFFGA